MQADVVKRLARGMVSADILLNVERRGAAGAALNVPEIKFVIASESASRNQFLYELPVERRGLRLRCFEDIDHLAPTIPASSRAASAFLILRAAAHSSTIPFPFSALA